MKLRTADIASQLAPRVWTSLCVFLDNTYNGKPYVKFDVLEIRREGAFLWVRIDMGKGAVVWVDCSDYKKGEFRVRENI